MNKLYYIILLISTISIGQILPTNADSIYYSPKYCNTAGSIEEGLNSWFFNGNIGDCMNPSEGILNALWPDLVMFDSYDCCCKVASTPSLQGSWNGYVGSPCEEYLNSIEFLSIEEIVIEQNGTYYDMQGRAYKTIPRGVSFMNYNKYFKL
jgi:hypothetical protein